MWRWFTLIIGSILGLSVILAIVMFIEKPQPEFLPYLKQEISINREAPIQSGAPPTSTLQTSNKEAAPTTNSRNITAMEPVGLPIRRSDWLILRDYQAHGGSGPNGAIAIGVLSNRDAVGTPIYATHDGTVRILRDNRRYGNLVAIKNDRWSTTYGFLDRIAVTNGQAVRRGDQIGTLGQSGTAPTPRLDYQVWEKVNGVETNRNPMDFLSEQTN